MTESQTRNSKIANSKRARKHQSVIQGISQLLLMCMICTTITPTTPLAQPMDIPAETPSKQAGVGQSGAPSAPRFTLADVLRRAEELATKPYKPSTTELPPQLQNLTYDQYRDIRFRPDHSLWRDAKLPFEAQFFSRGLFVANKVTLNEIDNGKSKVIPFSNDLYNFGKNNITSPLPADTGFAGFRLHYPLHKDSYYDEIAVFLGASYFRGVGRNQSYGLSARGLAIDTGLDKPEEFPTFTEFWLERPEKDATEITLYALLDTPAATGAYSFTITPGDATVFHVKSHLIMRHGVEKLGVAPLTSMFFYGENQEQRIDDFRPEIHDSDGILINNGGGEWIWRPLANPKRLRISSFFDTNPKGFGLLQRDRDFRNYEDLEAHYQKRPSCWVETIGNWGSGSVQLVEIPSNAEKYDNIVAYWVPKQETKAGDRFFFEYNLHFGLNTPRITDRGTTSATRIGSGGIVDVSIEGSRKFVVDFTGGDLAQIGADQTVEAVVSASHGKIINVVTHKNEFTNGWRVFFDYVPENKSPVELRCFLKSQDKALSETWNYQWEEVK